MCVWCGGGAVLRAALSGDLPWIFLCKTFCDCRLSKGVCFLGSLLPLLSFHFAQSLSWRISWLLGPCQGGFLRVRHVFSWTGGQGSPRSCQQPCTPVVWRRAAASLESQQVALWH